MMNRAFLVVAISAGLLTACVDPEKSFQDFKDRVPDASSTVMDAPDFDEIPDIGGQFLMKFSINQSLNIFLMVDVAFDEGPPPTLTYKTQPIENTGPPGAAHTGVLAGEEQQGLASHEAGASTTIAVDEQGRFEVHFPSLEVPASASPTGGDAVADATLVVQIVHADCFEGHALGGTVNPPGVTFDDISTVFAAVRVTDTDNLPEGVLDCPEMMAPMDASPDGTQDASDAALDSADDASSDASPDAPVDGTPG